MPSLGLFLVALLPRATGLGVFATVDEVKWVYRSAQFIGALLGGNPAGTLVNLTPGVTTTWLGALGLIVYYGLHQSELGMPFVKWLAMLPEFRTDIDVLVAVRWPMVLATSIGVVAFYYLARRLTDGWTASIFALSLALDPHFVALSRVLGHDAPAGLFVGLALLAFLRSVQQDAQRTSTSWYAGWRWLVVSGALTGLAWLSKSPAFFLAPFAGLVALAETWRRGSPLRIWLLRLAIWGIVAWVVFVLVWPAGWRDPLGAPYAVVENAFLSATDTVEAEAEGYWQVPDLGFFYYLVNGVFKLSPWATLGLIAWAWLALRKRHKPSSVEWWLLLFALLFILFITLGGKRSNRYILPAWPALYLLAAIGASRISQAWRPPVQAGPANLKSQLLTRNLQSVIRNVVLVSLLILPTLLSFPYYFPYFNPLLGGGLTAPHLVKIGWGEGLDQVGQWLDEQVDAPALRVGSYYASALAPFFAGRVSDVTAGGLDYVVFYIKQVQAGDPSPTILRYFAAQSPSYTVRLGGIDYAWVYPGPAMQTAMANEAAYDIGILPKPLAFRPNRPYLPLGDEVSVDVLWLAGNDLPLAPSRLTMQPVEDLARRPGERSNTVYAAGVAQLGRQPDGLVISRHQFKIPAELPRGKYGLLVDGRPLGVIEVRQFDLPPMDERLDVNFGDQLRLVGYTLDESTARLRLVWRAAPRAWADYTVFVHLVDAAGIRLAGADAPPPVPASQWARSEVIVDERVLPIPDSLGAGDYWLRIGLYRADTGERVPVLDAAGEPVGDSLMLPKAVTGPLNLQ